MLPIVAVVLVTDSYRDLWSSLVEGGAATVLQVEQPDEIPADAELAAIVIAAGGEEDRVVPLVGRLHGERHAEIAVVGGSTDHRLVATLIRRGAADYFALPGDLDGLRVWARTHVIPREGRPASAHGRAPGFSGIIGRSPKLLAALTRTARVIPHDATTVLITGETGTGKEVLARAIHEGGPRARGPFVEVNCAAIPASLVEAELFGYERGAFTDARQPKVGLMEAAEGGTLFLDEIGELPLELQAKLLTVVEHRRVRRLGAVRERAVNVRVLAATNTDLARAVHLGRFRADLYYRLSVVPIALPPLRERGDDIVILAEHFLRQFASRYAIQPPMLSLGERRALHAHSWPGNVRELRNAVERAIVLEEPLLAHGQLAHDLCELPMGEPLALAFPASLAEIDRAAARAAVERLNGNKTAAATTLGISRKHLYTLLGHCHANSRTPRIGRFLGVARRVEGRSERGASAAPPRTASERLVRPLT